MPYVALLCAMFLWSSSVIAGKSALAHYSITEVVLGRFICAAAVLWLLVLGFRHEFRLNRLSKRPLIMGLLDPGLVSLLLIWGLSQTAAVNTAVFWALMPLLMPILGRVVLKERLQPVVMVGAVIAVGGTFLLVSANLSSGEGSLFGDFLAIAAVLCACANSLIARRVAQDHGKPLVTTAYQMSVAILAALAAMLVFDRPDPAALEFGPPSMLVLYLGVFATAGPFLLFNYALRHVPVGMTGLFASLVGPMALPMAAFFLGEEISAQELIAMAIIVFGVVLPQFGDWRGSRPLGPGLKPEA